MRQIILRNPTEDQDTSGQHIPLCATEFGDARVVPSVDFYAPPSALRGTVEAIWTFSVGAVPNDRVVEYVAPDIGVELIWRLGTHPSLFVRGPQCRFSKIVIDATASYVGARLMPGLAPSLFKVAAATIRGSRFHIHTIAPSTRAQPEADGLRNVSPCEAYTRFAAILANAWATPPGATMAKHAAHRLQALHGQVSVEEVAREMQCSARHLRRTMIADIGVAPKAALRIVRLRRALRLLRACDQSLAAVALDAGYTDQAHMTRDFSALGAPSPNRLRRFQMSATYTTVNN
jgi:AraC-like DNA-binding protein